MSKKSDSMHESVLAGETENRCLKARIAELEQEVEKHSRRAEFAEDNSAATKNSLVQSEAKAVSLKDQIDRLEGKLKSSENLQKHLETELSRVSGENDRVKGNLIKIEDELNCEKSKNTLLSNEVKQLGEKYKSDIKLNQDQVKNLLVEVEDSKKAHTVELAKISQSCAHDVKVLQDKYTAIQAELTAANDEVRHQTAKTKSCQTQLRELDVALKQTKDELEAQTRRLEDSIKSNGTLKENSQILETELLNSRQEVAQFDIILKRSCAIAYPSKSFDSVEKMGELPNHIEHLQQSNDAFKTKTQQIALQLEHEKTRFEKQNREHAAARRTLLEEVAVAKDESVALSKKNTALGVDNGELKMQIQALKDKFEILAQELDQAHLKKEISRLNRK